MKEQLGDVRTYLGVDLWKPKVSFFELTSCEGCQLQILNNESTLVDFLALIDIVNFREAMTGGEIGCDIAFVEGSVASAADLVRLKGIRDNSGILVAFGSCACFGGVNQLKNRLDLGKTTRTAYGDRKLDTALVTPLRTHVSVNLEIFGCPVKKEEVERIVLSLVLGRSCTVPKYPVCMECRAAEAVCLYDLGEPCIGPITRAGCDAWCTTNRQGCWGCRGPAEGANVEEMMKIMSARGISVEKIMDRIECFGGFPMTAFRSSKEG